MRMTEILIDFGVKRLFVGWLPTLVALVGWSQTGPQLSLTPDAEMELDEIATYVASESDLIAVYVHEELNTFLALYSQGETSRGELIEDINDVGEDLTRVFADLVNLLVKDLVEISEEEQEANGVDALLTWRALHRRYRTLLREAMIPARARITEQMASLRQVHNPVFSCEMHGDVREAFERVARLFSGEDHLFDLNGCVRPSLGIVGWWPLDDDGAGPIVDIHDPYDLENLPGKLTGRFQTIDGVVAGAFRFDGTTHVDIPNAKWLNFGRAEGGDFSIVCWIRQAPGVGGTGVRTVLDKRVFAFVRGFSFFPHNVRGYSFFFHNRRPSLQLADGEKGGWTNYSARSSLPEDQAWHMVAVTVNRSSSEGGRFYVDGRPFGDPFNPTLRRGNLSNTSPLRIGRVSFGNAVGYTGDLDEVAIFNRALTPAEIMEQFQAGSKGMCK
ncbi:MAG: LamG domain-containing protein [Acidobacteriota bacterium]|nr:LamG domain-containing protein [Acidobacteriota bacterium]